MPLFVLINGRGGVGKTTTLRSLLENPLANWAFFDFDDGKYPPPKEGKSGGKEWRRKQHDWWIQRAKELHHQTGQHVCVLGVGIFPWQLEELPHASLLRADQYRYGVMTCSEQTRQERLRQRGSKTIQEYDSAKFRELLERFLESGVKEFSTENRTPPQVAEEIKHWLQSLPT